VVQEVIPAAQYVSLHRLHHPAAHHSSTIIPFAMSYWLNGAVDAAKNRGDSMCGILLSQEEFALRPKLA
jgi:hypothetical protein